MLISCLHCFNHNLRYRHTTSARISDEQSAKRVRSSDSDEDAENFENVDLNWSDDHDSVIVLSLLSQPASIYLAWWSLTFNIECWRDWASGKRDIKVTREHRFWRYNTAIFRHRSAEDSTCFTISECIIEVQREEYKHFNKWIWKEDNRHNIWHNNSWLFNFCIINRDHVIFVITSSFWWQVWSFFTSQSERWRLSVFQYHTWIVMQRSWSVESSVFKLARNLETAKVSFSLSSSFKIIFSSATLNSWSSIAIIITSNIDITCVKEACNHDQDAED